MVLLVQYIIGFVLLIFALYNSSLAFSSGIGGIANLIIAIGAALASFILLKDLYFAPLVSRLERMFYPQGVDTGSDFSAVDTLIYQQDFRGALAWLDEYLQSHENSSKGHYKKCSLLYDKMKDQEAAVTAGCIGLSQEKLGEDDERLIFLTLDILSEMGRLQQEVELIEQILKRIDKKALVSRLMLRRDSLSLV